MINGKPKSASSKTAKLLALLMGCCISFFLVEIVLRVFNPFEFRIRGNNIQLPRNEVMEFTIQENAKLDSLVRHTKNALGFRGDPPPLLWKSFYTIIVIGGSATECRFITDGKDWPSLLGKVLEKEYLNIWLNNAGLDGMSTVGHIRLMEQYVVDLRPNMAIFSIGANDSNVSRRRAKFDEKKIYSVAAENAAYCFETINVIINLWRYHEAAKAGLVHETKWTTTRTVRIADCTNYPHGKHVFSEEEYRHWLRRTNPDEQGYRERLMRLIDLCKHNDITPVFISQPALFLCTNDPETGANIAAERSGNTYRYFQGLLLKRFNEILQEVCELNDVRFIDLAERLPMDTRYYYDKLHYSNAGCEKIAQILGDEFVNILNSLPHGPQKKAQGKELIHEVSD